MTTEDNAVQYGWSEETSRAFIDYSRYFVPERDQQMHIIASLLSNHKGPGLIMDLCCGEGLLTELILDTFPELTVIGLDGSIEMLQRAQKRLIRFGDRFHCSNFDLAGLDWRNADRTINAVVSSMAIHHLTASQKQKLFHDIYQMLAVGGSFIIADIVEIKDEIGTKLAAESWDEVVRKRSVEIDGNLEAFEFFKREGWNMFRCLDPEDIDKPSPLLDQLKWLENAGFEVVDVHWMLAGHAIFSAIKN